MRQAVKFVSLLGLGTFTLWVILTTLVQYCQTNGISGVEEISAVSSGLIRFLKIATYYLISMCCGYFLGRIPQSWKLFDEDVLEKDWAEGELERLLMKMGREGFPGWLPWHVKRAGYIFAEIHSKDKSFWNKFIGLNLGANVLSRYFIMGYVEYALANLKSLLFYHDGDREDWAGCMVEAYATHLWHQPRGKEDAIFDRLIEETLKHLSRGEILHVEGLISEVSDQPRKCDYT